MLAISPPLHQDFRARAHQLEWLCSPGDGWRQYAPPPPPVLPVAFHFLAPLLLPEAYAISRQRIPQIVVRPKMDERLNGTLEKVLHLPTEIMQEIVNLVVDQGTGMEMINSSRYFNSLATPRFFRSIDLKTAKSVAMFNNTLERRPELGSYIRELTFGAHRLPWDEVKRLADLLGEKNRMNIKMLKVKIPASDLPLALPILTLFSPKCFEWSTSPCWQMRPANLFVEMFAGWKRLDDLTLVNFRFDETLNLCVDQLPNLQHLALKGRGSEHLPVEVLSTLMNVNNRSNAIISFDFEFVNAKRQFPIEIADCSQEKRTILEQELTKLYIDPEALRCISWV